MCTILNGKYLKVYIFPQPTCKSTIIHTVKPLTCLVATLFFVYREVVFCYFVQRVCFPLHGRFVLFWSVYCYCIYWKPKHNNRVAGMRDYYHVALLLFKNISCCMHLLFSINDSYLGIKLTLYIASYQVINVL